ncbi:hypothetical protein RBB50_002128 [Rhinocladiella similis]
MSLPTEKVFTLIVGGGPVGLTTALILARYGYESLVLERHAERMDQPKAHVLNPRTLEIYRQLGIDIAPLREAGVPPHEADVVRFVTSMRDIEFGLIDRAKDNDLSISPEAIFNVAQPFLEDHLLKAATASGKVSYLRMYEWQACFQEDDQSIVSSILCRKTDTVVKIKSKYLIGCDGAKARSRSALGIQFDPLFGSQQRVLHYASIHFRADLSHFKTGLIWFIMNPKRMSAFIAYNRRNSWVYFTQYDPEVTPKSIFTSEYMRDLVFQVSRIIEDVTQSDIFQGVGRPVPDYTEIGITLWTTSPQLARTYRSECIPNAFLAGDAAHSFPPTGGLGLNTGVADVQNLVWKIQAVEQGWATEAFLDTVTAERLPVAKENCRQSKENEDKIFHLVHTIFKPGCTAEELIADPVSRQQIQSAIAENREHFNSFNLQLGYVYGQPFSRGPSDYQKELVRGARLPHFWVEERGQAISTLDLVDGMSFVLVCDSTFTELSWLTCSNVPVAIKQSGKDFDDRVGAWTEYLEDLGVRAVLVRPDHHIVDRVSRIEEVGEMLQIYLST